LLLPFFFPRDYDIVGPADLIKGDRDWWSRDRPSVVASLRMDAADHRLTAFGAEFSDLHHAILVGFFRSAYGQGRILMHLERADFVWVLTGEIHPDLAPAYAVGLQCILAERVVVEERLKCWLRVPVEGVKILRRST
jgi:hypothetical protein